MSPTNEAAIAALLREAAAAHAEYETNVLQGVRDEAWPAWYATWLLEHGIRDLLPSVNIMDNERLAAQLTELDANYRRESPSGEWPEFYAGRLATSSR
jgi:hypothetical protein